MIFKYPINMVYFQPESDKYFPSHGKFNYFQALMLILRIYYSIYVFSFRITQ